jgi:uncharacterized protein
VAAHLGAAVARELDEVERVRDRDRAREVGEEDEACLQRADEQRLAALEVARNLRAELRDTRGQLAGRKVDLADARVYVTRSRRKC